MNGKDGSGGAARLVMMLAVAVIGLVGVCDRAVGQVRSIDTRYVTVVGGGSEGAVLRCAPDVIWYGVANVRAGEVLEVDGEKDGWYRAGYPLDGRVVVKLNEGEHIRDEGVVLLKRRSRLAAYNPQDPVHEECWKGVFSDNQPRAGTKLIYVEDMLDRSGAHSGYVVVAPEGARGYILKDAVRDATSEEIATYQRERGRISDLAEARHMDQPIRRRAETPVIGRDGGIAAAKSAEEIKAEREAELEAIAQAERERAEQAAREQQLAVDTTIETEPIDEALRDITESAGAAADVGQAWISTEQEPADEPRSEWSLGGDTEQLAQGSGAVTDYEPFEQEEGSGSGIGNDAATEEMIAEPAAQTEEVAADPNEGIVDHRYIEDAEDYREPDYWESERTEMMVNQELQQLGEQFSERGMTAGEFGGSFVTAPPAEESEQEEAGGESEGAWINPTGRVLTLNELDAAYERVVAREGDNPEYATLIEEYKRHASRLPDSVESARTRGYIQTRVQLLEIAAELAEGEAQLAALAMDAEYAGSQAVHLARRVRETSGFDLVGRLVSSAVYDGERLPMLYRLVSVEGRVGRTVAYLTDEAALGMDGKLGSVVGVRGVGEPGEVGLVRVIRPEEVTVLTGVASAEWSE